MRDSMENEPLLYIEQPKFTQPEAQMQDSFRSSNEVKRDEKSPIQQKIDELLDLPEEIPVMTCEIVTKDESVNGKILKQEETTITVLLANNEEKIISKEDVTNIHYISF